jgi:predicted dehydrogenase
MRVAVIGLGVQGRKRRAIAGADVVATIDPISEGADFRTVEEVGADRFDAALVCTPDGAKIELLRFLLDRGKHVLVEKPLLGTREELDDLKRRAERGKAICYTAYNHRFEPHFVRMRDLIASGRLGRLYSCRMFYGNGTARDVRDSAWRDSGSGVLTDLGSHLLDTATFWFGPPEGAIRLRWAERFENRAFDHVAFGIEGRPRLDFEMTLLSWRNHFTCDLFAEHGTAPISSLCKWGPTTFTVRGRVLPSGRPPEEAVTLVQPDPTWALEYDHFKAICAAGHGSNTDQDVRITAWLGELAAQGK